MNKTKKFEWHSEQTKTTKDKPKILQFLDKKFLYKFPEEDRRTYVIVGAAILAIPIIILIYNLFLNPNSNINVFRDPNNQNNTSESKNNSKTQTNKNELVKSTSSNNKNTNSSGNSGNSAGDASNGSPQDSLNSTSIPEGNNSNGSSNTSTGNTGTGQNGSTGTGGNNSGNGTNSGGGDLVNSNNTGTGSSGSGGGSSSNNYTVVTPLPQEDSSGTYDYTGWTEYTSPEFGIAFKLPSSAFSTLNNSYVNYIFDGSQKNTSVVLLQTKINCDVYSKFLKVPSSCNIDSSYFPTVLKYSVSNPNYYNAYQLLSHPENSHYYDSCGTNCSIRYDSNLTILGVDHKVKILYNPADSSTQGIIIEGEVRAGSKSKWNIIGTEAFVEFQDSLFPAGNHGLSYTARKILSSFRYI